MPAAPRAWTPANDLERRMHEAFQVGDIDGYLTELAAAPLYLASRGPDPSGTGQRLLTRDRPDGRYLLVFTSVGALRDGVGQMSGGWLPTTFAELATRWREPSWGVAVSPTTPMGTYLTAEQVTGLADLTEGQAPPHPAEATERLLRAARAAEDPGLFLDLLVVARVAVPTQAYTEAAAIGTPDFPWRLELIDGVPALAVYTSDRRLRAALGDAAPAVVVDFLSLVRAWPHPSYRLVLDPGGLDVTFTGPQVADLVNWARYLVARDGGPPTEAAPAPAPVPEPGVAVAPGEVGDVLRGLAG